MQLQHAHDAAATAPPAAGRGTLANSEPVARPDQYSRPATSPTTQSSPSSSPAPEMAEHGTMRHLCDSIASRPSALRTCSSESEPARSCLFAKTSSVAPASRCVVSGGHPAHPPPRTATPAARPPRRLAAKRRSSRRPTRPRPSTRSNCANMVGVYAGLRRPLCILAGFLQASRISESHAQIFSVYSPRTSVWMLNPSVGETVDTSPPDTRFRMVVLPALSRPLNVRLYSASSAYRNSTRISRALALFLRMMVRRPGGVSGCVEGGEAYPCLLSSRSLFLMAWAGCGQRRKGERAESRCQQQSLGGPSQR